MTQTIIQDIRDQARQWLESGEVKFVIGYEQGDNSGNARPVFIYEAAEADKLVWNDRCYNNLTKFLVNDLQYKPKRGEEVDVRPVGVIVKPCDSKTIVELMKENMVPRERVKIIGLTCEGVANTKGDGLEGKCLVCTNHNPLVSDIVFGAEIPETYTEDFEDLKELEAMSPDERWKYWEEQVSRCVRCYACKDGCPLCYCKECVFERVKPYKWNEKSVKTRENVFYHVVRAMHLAGRCIDCGECERACPMDIPIRKLNRYLAKKSKERFGIEAGTNVEDKSVFRAYDTNDPGEEIW